MARRGRSARGNALISPSHWHVGLAHSARPAAGGTTQRARPAARLVPCHAGRRAPPGAMRTVRRRSARPQGRQWQYLCRDHLECRTGYRRWAHQCRIARSLRCRTGMPRSRSAARTPRQPSRRSRGGRRRRPRVEAAYSRSRLGRPGRRRSRQRRSTPGRRRRSIVAGQPGSSPGRKGRDGRAPPPVRTHGRDPCLWRRRSYTCRGPAPAGRSPCRSGRSGCCPVPEGAAASGAGASRPRPGCRARRPGPPRRGR
jgi:hypothetical protein